MNKASVAQHAKTSDFFLPAKSLLQRKCACGNRTIADAECPKCRKKNSLFPNRESAISLKELNRSLSDFGMTDFKKIGRAHV